MLAIRSIVHDIGVGKYRTRKSVVPERIAFRDGLKGMLHQLKVIKDGHQTERFLFRSSPEEDPELYVMDIVWGDMFVKFHPIGH